MEIGDRIKEVRTQLDMSQDEFGKGIGVTKAAVSTYERGKRKPTERTLNAICSKYNINYSYLKSGEGKMLSSSPKTSFESMAVEYKLNDLERILIFDYLKLSKADRSVFIKYLKKIINDYTGS